MSKSEVEKFIGSYVDIVCGPGNADAENFGGVITDIDDNGYAYVDWGYGVRIEHIINIKPSDIDHSEEID